MRDFLRASFAGYSSHPWPLRQPASGSALASLAHFVSHCLLACAGARGVNCNIRRWRAIWYGPPQKQLVFRRFCRHRCAIQPDACRWGCRKGTVESAPSKSGETVGHGHATGCSQLRQGSPLGSTEESLGRIGEGTGKQAAPYTHRQGTVDDRRYKSFPTVYTI